MTEDGHKVSLNVYDLSQGLARQLSTMFLGRAIEGIWHTGIVVYGNEYYFGGGIQHSPVGTTPYGTPIRVVDLGVTHVPQELFEDYLQDISPQYTAETYSLLNNNCNNFSNEVAQFLVGNTIPEYILQLPNEVTSSPMGAMILPMLQQLETTLRSGAVPQIPQFRPSSSSLTQPIFTVNANNKSEGRPNTISAREANIDNTEVPVKSDDHCPMETGIMSEKPPHSDTMVQPAVKPAGAQVKKTNRVIEDPLGDARSKVQEEISNEFAALMASGTLRASEAAALATRRVMERYGRLNVAMPQS